MLRGLSKSLKMEGGETGAAGEVTALGVGAEILDGTKLLVSCSFLYSPGNYLKVFNVVFFVIRSEVVTVAKRSRG